MCGEEVIARSRRSKFYVYQHIDPDTKEIVYVGKGSGGRAWQCGTSHSPLRHVDHCEWADSLLELGYTPADFVFIIEQNLSEDAAKDLESQLIYKLRPLFNRSIRSPLLKFTPDVYRKALELREQGFSYKHIGEIVGVSAMVVHRGINKMPISLEIALNNE